MPYGCGALTALATGFQSTIGSRREDGGQEMNTNKQPQKRRTARIITGVLLVVVVGLMWLGSNSHLYPGEAVSNLSLIHISEPTRLGMISYAVFCLTKKNAI